MEILVNPDDGTRGSNSLEQYVESVIIDTIGRFSDRITQVEVHVQDTNARKGGDRDKRCAMEARVSGLRPIAVTHLAPQLVEAIEGAAHKLEHVLERALARIDETAGQGPPEADVTTVERPQMLDERRDSGRKH